MCGVVASNLVWCGGEDRKSTRLNSSHVEISYAVFCLKKKKGQAPGERVDICVSSRAKGHQVQAFLWGLAEPVNLLLRIFFFNDTATTEIYTLSLHDALPI